MHDDSFLIATLCGSLRTASYSRAVSDSLPELAPPGTGATALRGMEDLPHYDEDLRRAGMPGIIDDWCEVLARADALVITTPEYNFSIPGVLKNALDWLSRVNPGPLLRKPVAIQTCSPGLLGGVRAQYHLRQVLVFFDATVLNKPEVIIPQIDRKLDAQRRLVDAGTRDIVAAQLVALRRLAKEAA